MALNKPAAKEVIGNKVEERLEKEAFLFFFFFFFFFFFRVRLSARFLLLISHA